MPEINIGFRPARLAEWSGTIAGVPLMSGWQVEWGGVHGGQWGLLLPMTYILCRKNGARVRLLPSTEIPDQAAGATMSAGSSPIPIRLSHRISIGMAASVRLVAHSSAGTQ